MRTGRSSSRPFVARNRRRRVAAEMLRDNEGQKEDEIGEAFCSARIDLCDREGTVVMTREHRAYASWPRRVGYEVRLGARRATNRQ